MSEAQPSWDTDKQVLKELQELNRNIESIRSDVVGIRFMITVLIVFLVVVPILLIMFGPSSLIYFLRQPF